jgi:hypothetical protein
MKFASFALSALCLAAFLFASVSPARAGVADDYSTPTFRIPYCEQKPQIDGKIGQEEWQGAMSVRALQTTRHQVSSRQTRFWVMWDEDHLYLAMRSPLREGERPIQAIRRRRPEKNVVFDDSYEIWMDVGERSPDGMDCFVQFLANFAGNRYDVLHLPTVGNSRVTWNSGWEPVNRINEENEWEWEMVVPRQTLYRDEPFVDGFVIRGLLARNYKRPWEQNSVEGTGSFSVSDTYSKWILSREAPAVHLLSVGDPRKPGFGLEVAAHSKRNRRLSWEFLSDGGVQKNGEMMARAGRLGRVTPGLALGEPGEGDYRIRVTSADGKITYLDWAARRKFANVQALDQKIQDSGDEVKLSLRFNPVADYVRVTGDFINYDARETIDHCHAEVMDSDGQKLGEHDMRIDELAYVEGVIKLGRLSQGQYRTTLQCLGEDGKVIIEREKTFSKKDHSQQFAWWKTGAGNADRVLEPWTPVGYRQGEINVWGREMAIGPAGIPAGITSQGRGVTAGTGSLVAELPDGASVSASEPRLETISAADHRAVVKVTSELAGLTVESKVTAEYDGMYRVDMTLTPGGEVTVRSLRAVLPLANETADYVHASGEGIRYGFYHGFLPEEAEGRVWDSSLVRSQPMLVGSFIPYVWVGSPERGLCLFADSDRGWVPEDDVPAIELRRDDADSTDLVLNLIGSEFTIRQPRHITFAFQATPVKKMHKQWRMDSWWCGDTFKDWQFLKENGGHQIWTNIPFTLEPEKCRQKAERQHRGSNSFILGVDKYRANVVPYLEWKRIAARFAPEVRYFGEHWRTRISSGLAFEKSLRDYLTYHMSEWARTCKIDGIYLDNVRPQACDNLAAGRGYRLPDGRVQPTYQVFALRRLFLRFRAAFQEQRPGERKFVIHMTNNLIIPWIGAADMAYDGEHHVIYPEMNKDFMDFWSLERLRMDYPAQWGTAVNFMHEYQGNWPAERHAKAFRAYTGMILLHDALPSGNANGKNRYAWIARDRFGIQADDVEFIGYWVENSGLSSDTEEVYLAGWKRPGKLLIAVVNKGEKADVKISIDPEKLGLADPTQWKVTDAEAGTKDYTPAGPVQVTEDGRLILLVPRHDYRQIIVE